MLKKLLTHPAKSTFNADDAYALAGYLRTQMPVFQGRKIEDCAIHGRPLLPMIEQLEALSPAGCRPQALAA